MDWKQLEAKIIATVNRVAEKHYKVHNEVWVSAEDMHKHVSIMTKRWLRDHGDMFPRQQMVWKDENGQEHASSFMYPLHEILEMIADGRCKELKKKNIC